MPDSPEEYYASSDESDSQSEFPPNYPDSNTAYPMGRHQRADQTMARHLLQNPHLLHEYDPRFTTGPQQRITTGNYSGAPAITQTPNWNPPLPVLANATYDAKKNFPDTTPEQRTSYVDASGSLVNAKVLQSLTRAAYGPLETVGASYNPTDPETQVALDRSVGTSFEVMKAGAQYEAARQHLAKTQRENRAAEAQSVARGASSSKAGKSSPPSSKSSKRSR